MLQSCPALLKTVNRVCNSLIIPPEAVLFCNFEEFEMSQDLLKSVVAPENANVPQVRPGDVVDVHVRIKEGNRERIQVFRGTVIRVRDGANEANFTVRRVASNGIGVERTFLRRSPLIEKVVVERHSHVRRSRLYFLRERTGKSARLKQRFSN